MKNVRLVLSGGVEASFFAESSELPALRRVMRLGEGIFEVDNLVIAAAHIVAFQTEDAEEEIEDDAA